MVTGTGGAVLDLSFARNNDSRLGGVTDNAGTGRSATASDTPSGRLSAANGPWGAETFSYDAAGNRTSDILVAGGVTTTDTEIPASVSNQLTQTQDASSTVKRT